MKDKNIFWLVLAIVVAVLLIGGWYYYSSQVAGPVAMAANICFGSSFGQCGNGESCVAGTSNGRYCWSMICGYPYYGCKGGGVKTCTSVLDNYPNPSASCKDCVNSICDSGGTYDQAKAECGKSGKACGSGTGGGGGTGGTGTGGTTGSANLAGFITQVQQIIAALPSLQTAANALLSALQALQGAGGGTN